MAMVVEKNSTSTLENKNQTLMIHQENSSNEQQQEQQQEQEQEQQHQQQKEQLNILEDTSIERPINSARRSTMKIINKRPLNAISMAKQARELENQYFTKKKRFILLKTQLVQKQKTTQDLYQDINQLREKMILNGGKDPGKLEELKIIELDSSKTPTTYPQSKNQQQINPNEQKILINNTNMNNNCNNINSEFIITLNNKLKEITKRYEQYCEDVLKKHSFMIISLEKYMDEIFQSSNIDTNNETTVSFESYRSDNETLKVRFDEIKSNQLEIIQELMKNTCDFYGEYENCRLRVKELSKTLDELKDNREKLTTLMEELQTERDKHNLTKERRIQNEGQLQRARTKIRDLENKISNDEVKMQQLQIQNKSLENQMRSKEQSMEQRLKDMQKTIRNSEGLVSKMEKQRDSFEARLFSLFLPNTQSL
ncbi:hypothetical protein M0802_008644 [Mischocyttarus mexicanus]|nr:hypothetical protein M0802_008644 [Mischocyttarus mexicanus]